MTIQFPAEYSGGFDDAEAVVRDFLKPALALLDANPEVYAWLPANYHEKLPLVSVARSTGVGDWDVGVDRPQVEIMAICASRADSVALNEYIRQMMMAYRRGGPVKRANGSKSVIAGVEEVVGPELLQATDWDERIVPSTFIVELKKTADTATYARFMRDLHR